MTARVGIPDGNAFPLNRNMSTRRRGARLDAFRAGRVHPSGKALDVYVNVNYNAGVCSESPQVGTAMEPFAPADIDFTRRVHASFARQGIMRHIGARIVAVEPGRCEIVLPYGEHVSQQHGFFHGGVVATVADSAAGYAAFSLMPADAGVLSVEFKINLVAPADGDRLIAKGRVLRPGRTLAVCQAEVFVSKGPHERLCAIMQQTLMTIVGRADVVG